MDVAASSNVTGQRTAEGGAVVVTAGVVEVDGVNRAPAEVGRGV